MFASIDFSSADPGPVTASLAVLSDGRERVTTAELRAEVVIEPQVVIIDTHPTGLAVTVDGQVHTTPVAFTVLTGAVANNEWEPGSIHTLAVAEAQDVEGLPHAFQQWDPAASREFELLASATESPRYVAHFVANPDPKASRASQLKPGAMMMQSAGVEPPADLPAGPWLRLSQAALSIPSLGNLDVNGSLFLNAHQFTAILDSGTVRIPASTSQPGLLEISGGSWRLDYVRLGDQSLASLRVLSPGLELLEIPVAPPSQLVFDYATNGDFTASFATLGNTPMIPGIFEMGPASIEFTQSGGFFGLEAQGHMNLLRNTDGAWAVSEPLVFQASEGPFSHEFGQLPPTLLPLGFMSVNTDSSSIIAVQRDGNGVFSLAVSNLDLVLLGQSFANLSGSAASDGRLNLNAAPPANPFAIGPLRLEVDEDTSVEWNVRTGALEVSLPASQLKASGISGWPANGIPFPEFTLDSEGDFEKKIQLPNFTFDGIGIASGGSLASNYLLVKRQAGVVSLKLRDRRDFLGSSLDLALDVASSGDVSGSFRGSFDIDTTYFGNLDFGTVTMYYDPTENTYQFQQRFPLAGNDFGLFFGSGGAQFSHLNCDGPDLEDCDEGLFSITSP